MPAALGSWQSGGPPIPPGSLVVVLQDPSPYETWGFIRDLTSVLGQISISSAALAVISKQRGRADHKIRHRAPAERSGARLTPARAMGSPAPTRNGRPG
ncbi:hypothetical protein ACFQX4_25050 [Roseomonas sp. GCM10028921]